MTLNTTNIHRAWSLLALALLGGCGDSPADPRGELRGGPSVLPDPRDEAPGLAAPDEDGLLPRIAIAGHTGLRVTTRVQFLSDPFVPHESRYTFVFPDRALWRLENTAAPESSRVQAYRHGSLLHWLPAGSGASVPLEGEDRDTVHRRFELRRAFALFPDGFDWSEGDERRATLFDGQRELGELIARVDAAGELLDLEVRAPDGTGSERLERLAPAANGAPRFRVFEGAAEVAVETLLERDPRAELPDWRFLPPDRRPEGSGGFSRVLEGEGLSLDGEALRAEGPLGLQELAHTHAWPDAFQGMLESIQPTPGYPEIHTTLWIRTGTGVYPTIANLRRIPLAEYEPRESPGVKSHVFEAWPPHWALGRDRSDPRALPTLAEVEALRANLPTGAVELGLLIERERPGRLEIHFSLPADHELERSRPPAE